MEQEVDSPIRLLANELLDTMASVAEAKTAVLRLGHQTGNSKQFKDLGINIRHPRSLILILIQLSS